MKKISKLQEHDDMCVRFLKYENGHCFSPDTGESFYCTDTYIDDPNCANCGWDNWFPGKLIKLTDNNCCVYCNKHFYRDQWADSFGIDDVQNERLRAERECDVEDAII